MKNLTAAETLESLLSKVDQFSDSKLYSYMMKNSESFRSLAADIESDSIFKQSEQIVCTYDYVPYSYFDDCFYWVDTHNSDENFAKGDQEWTSVA